MDKASQIASDVTVFAKYAKYLEKEGRRENWDEIVNRYQAMLFKKVNGKLPDHTIIEACNLIREKKVLPSMRCLQFAGGPIERNNARNYNCAYHPADREEFFKETMFLLLGGTGVGYSVQKHHVDKLPTIKKPKKPKKWLVGDSIEGWADAVGGLMKAYFRGNNLPVFDYSDIRPKGARLITAGGKAPGPAPLRVCLDKILGLLEAKPEGSKLEPWEVSDIACYIADAVLSGGIRRSAMICLFDSDDEKMLHYKSGAWWELNPERGRANISAVALRSKTTKADFDRMWEATRLSNAGEPGLFWTSDETKEVGTNPCVPATETVFTGNGVQYVGDLIGTPFNAMVDGASVKAEEYGFVSTGVKDVFKLITQEGYELEATANHLIYTPGGWRELGSLSVGDKVSLHKHQGVKWGGRGNREIGWLVGSLLGDGTFNHNNAYLEYWGDSAEEMCKIASDLIRTHVGGRSDLGSGIAVGRGKKRVGSVKLKQVAGEFGVTPSKTLDASLSEIGTSSDFYEGFLSGWFDADGSIQGNHTKGISIRLGSINRNNLLIAQRMLLRLGVYSVIRKCRDTGARLMPDGNGGMKEYICQASHELMISRESLAVFSERIGFKEPAKAERLAKSLSAYKRKLNTVPFTCRVKEIVFTGTKEVYDCTVPGPEAFDASGFYVHNCCEILLNPRQMCNLTTINYSTVVSADDFMARVRAATILGTIQASFTDFHYLSPEWRETCEREALLGVSMTGLADNPTLKLDLESFATYAKAVNEEIAGKLGINVAARITCTKPEGTSSLVLGTASGIHARHAKHYIRRFRFKKNEALAWYLMDKFPKLVVDDKMSSDAVILELPQKAPEGSIIRGEHPISLLERVKDVHTNWIRPGHRYGVDTHNVSCTVSIKDDEWDAVGLWMWVNRDSYTGLSVLPFDGGSYVQPPFENCSEEEYERRMKDVGDFDISLVTENEDETEVGDTVACAGGACLV